MTVGNDEVLGIGEFLDEAPEICLKTLRGTQPIGMGVATRPAESTQESRSLHPLLVQQDMGQRRVVLDPVRVPRKSAVDEGNDVLPLPVAGQIGTSLAIARAVLLSFVFPAGHEYVVAYFDSSGDTMLSFIGGGIIVV